jgi:MoaA/NifB/PqqE/SkfB family radical SAM enzyme
MRFSDLTHLELGFSNLCNLTCVTCSSTHSSAWYRHEDSFALASGVPRPPKEEPFHINHAEIPSLVEAARHASQINLAGGEPFADPRYRQFLRELAEINPGCDMCVTTNGSLFDDEAFAIFNRFHRGAIDFSVDGTGKLFEYIRGFPFSRLEENLDRACGLRRGILVSIHFTMSVYNVLNLPDVILWAQAQAERYAPRRVQLNLDQVVEGPPQMAPSLLPRSLVQETLYRLEGLGEMSVVRAGDLAWIISYLRALGNAPSELLLAAKKSTSYMNCLRGFAVWEAEPRLEFLASPDFRIHPGERNRAF